MMYVSRLQGSGEVVVTLDDYVTASSDDIYLSLNFNGRDQPLETTRLNTRTLKFTAPGKRLRASRAVRIERFTAASEYSVEYRIRYSSTRLIPEIGIRWSKTNGHLISHLSLSYNIGLKLVKIMPEMFLENNRRQTTLQLAAFTPGMKAQV